MRYVTVVLSVSEDHVSSLCHQLSGKRRTNRREVWIDDTLIATQEGIRYLNLLEDGTAVGIFRFRGDAEQLVRLESESPTIISCTVTPGQIGLAYLHYEPPGFEGALLELFDSEAISVDWPMVETPDGLQVTFFGEDVALQRLVANIPEPIDLTLEGTGDFSPSMDDPTAQLTDRQAEIMRAAVAAGYYEIPRRVTQRGLADELGVSRGTIADHLRRIESKLIRAVVG